HSIAYRGETGAVGVMTYPDGRYFRIHRDSTHAALATDRGGRVAGRGRRLRLQPAALPHYLLAEQPEAYLILGPGKFGMVFHARAIEVLHQIGASRAVAVLLVERLGDRTAEGICAVMRHPVGEE